MSHCLKCAQRFDACSQCDCDGVDVQELRAEKRKLEQENEKLQAQVAMLRELLTVSRCPNDRCDNQNIEQCQFCFERNALLAETASSDAWMKEQTAKWLGEIDDFCMDALQSDLENGVKWLNEEASKEFHSKYPNIADALGKAGRMASELRSPESDVDRATRMT